MEKVVIVRVGTIVNVFHNGSHLEGLEELGLKKDSYLPAIVTAVNPHDNREIAVTVFPVGLAPFTLVNVGTKNHTDRNADGYKIYVPSNSVYWDFID